MHIYHTTSLGDAASILNSGFCDADHFIDGVPGVWVTDLPYCTVSSSLVCLNFPEELFNKHEHEWAHAWRKSFVPSEKLNSFDWVWHYRGMLNFEGQSVEDKRPR